MSTPNPHDLMIESHGSLCLVRPYTREGTGWLAETAPDDAQFLGSAMVVEPRYIEDVVIAARTAGLVVT